MSETTMVAGINAYKTNSNSSFVCVCHTLVKAVVEFGSELYLQTFLEYLASFFVTRRVATFSWIARPPQRAR